MGGKPAEAPPRRDGWRALQIAIVFGADTGGVLLLIGHFTGYLWLGSALFFVALGSYSLAYRWQLLEDRLFLAAWVTVAVVVALVSLIWGPYNGLTDEPFLTPAFQQLWPNLYGHSIVVSYVQYGRAFTTLPLSYVYLPLLPFLAIPFVDYRWTTLLAWGASLYLLRRRPPALVLWGGVWVGVLAANGFNDYLPFFVLTLTYVTLTGAASRLAEYLSLALKQFANVLVVAVHLYRREWRDAALAVLVTALILAPFAYLSPAGVWCHAILIEPTACTGGAGPVFGASVLSHVNYPLWVMFVLAVFGPAWVQGLRAAPEGGLRGRLGALARRWTLPQGPGRRST